ncbi:MAG: DUF896 domain-containing protein [Oscillospiraceae bacterium]|nr:DUF896 domain-containing protein [Oscillospiraceae bacterium]
MEKEKIDRINHLARKSREQGLTEEEKLEQQQLRDEYREGFKRGLAQHLDNVYYKMPDGSLEKAVKGEVKIPGVNTEEKK